MAVVDKYVDSDIEAGKLASASTSLAAHLVASVVTFEIPSGDDDTSVYRFLKDVPANFIPIKMDINNDAITGGTDYDVGIYGTSLGDAIDADVFADGLDLSSAHAIGSEISGLADVDISDLGQTVYEHAGHTVSDKKAAYDIALTANTIGSATGTVTITTYFLIDG